MNKSLKNRFWLFFFPLVYLVSDVTLRFSLLQLYSFKQLIFYVLSVIYFIVFYFIISQIIQIVSTRKWLYYTLICLCSIYFSTAILGSYTFYLFNGFFPNFYTYEYLKNEPLSAFVLLKDSINTRDFFLFVIGVLSISFLIYQNTKRYILTIKTKQFIYLSISSFALFILLVINVKKYDQCYIVDTNFLAAWTSHLIDIDGKKEYKGRGLEFRTPTLLDKTKNERDFNVLVVICESLRKHNLNFYGYHRNTTPYLSTLKKNYPENLYIFEKPYTVSTTTMLAVPAVITGIAPYQSKTAFYSQPTLWDLAETVNYNTFMISSHSFKWYRFDRFYAIKHPDHLWSKDHSPYPFYNDLGINDIYTINHVISHVEKHKKTPFFGVIQLNGTHYPYKVPGSFEKWSGSFVDTYDNAIYYEDYVIHKLINYLTKTKQLDNTVIFFTSDHGESLKDHNNIGHVDSYYAETISVPLFAFIPDKIKQRIPLSQFKKNRMQIVSTIDIAPTIVDLLEINQLEKVQNIRKKYSGYSLFRPIPKNRSIITMSNNEIARFNVGVSLIQNQYHFIHRLNIVPHRDELYTIQKDPKETKNRIQFIPKKQLNRLLDEIKKYPVSKRYLLK
jgi:glucan phosphoethanolaminetransferase (alkaline phosphatase superfamily)